MEFLYLMIICSVSLAVIFLIVFIINARKGQFEDDESPAVRILFDDDIQQDKPLEEALKSKEKQEKNS